MKNKTRAGGTVSDQEMRLIEQLREQPEIQERLAGILAITRNEDGPLRSADEVEELLIAEMRRLGSVALHQWATRAEERVSAELKAADATVRSRKKKR